jgi:hypothetical protein
MADELIEFVIDGSEERHGAIPADAFLAKLRAFITTLYAFDRAFTKRDRRQLDLEIVDLSRSSPGRVAMKARTRAQGYEPNAALEWTFDQIKRIHAGEAIDPTVPREAIDNVIDLASARPAKLPELGVMRARFNGKVIDIDRVLHSRALAIRAQHEELGGVPWRAGMSRGSLIGHLRGVMDFDGERQFFIMPRSGPYRVQCIFPEELRAKMNEHLFQVVRVVGFLHYNGTSPHPYLLEAEAVDGITPPERHFSELRGLFKDDDLPTPEGWA